ncbi:Glycosyl transferase family 2 [uncultured Paludibacter sp.]|uniref:Glycosyl transferase family 2 n=1 Tax=uncultured Paludibacter sp. TaxID=497635 RepID=A0A653A659_9BACT|nr:Glycosyl transferase family 2 [uncultured Paludibacter sp.]
MSVAIVILNWNTEKYLKKFLPLLQEYSKNVRNVEIIVADNGSNDGSVKLMQEEFPEIRTILFEKNYGFAEGYNKALKEIESQYYVLLNSDVEVTPNWLSVLYDYMEKNKDVSACQPKILSYHRRSYFEYAGAAGGFIDKYGYPFCRGRIFGEVEEDKGQYDEIVDVFWATGACLFIRSVDFWEAGGFDEEFFAHQEEIDLCWRLKSRGKRIVCIPQSVVYHIGGGTLKAENPYKTYLNFRNNLLLLYKNLPHKSLKKIFDIRFYLDNLAALHLLMKARMQNAKAISDARTDFRKMVGKFNDKRNENILKSNTAIDKELVQTSIIYEYYVKRHTKFSQIQQAQEVIKKNEE